MRFSLYLLLLSALLTHLHAAEYGMLSLGSNSFPNTITLSEGDIFETVGLFQEQASQSYILAYEKGTDTTLGEVAISSERIFEDYAMDLRNCIITGPLVLLLKSTYSGTGGNFTVSYKLTRRPDPQAVSTPTAN